MPQFWLVKSEAAVYSIDDLKKDRATSWTGIRNYQARNFMRDQMKPGDLVLYYHSNSDPTGIAGIAKVSKLAGPDATAFDKKSEYYDPKATKDDPIWCAVELSFVEKFSTVVTLEQLKADSRLQGMPVLQRGQRLSVMPISAEHFKIVCELANTK